MLEGQLQLLLILDYFIPLINWKAKDEK